MIPLPKRTLVWIIKGKVLLQLCNKSKLRNGTKTFSEQNVSLFLVKFKKLGFSTPLTHVLRVREIWSSNPGSKFYKVLRTVGHHFSIYSLLSSCVVLLAICR